MVTHGEYKGKRTITLMNDDKDQYPFTFGVGKARKIVANYNAILDFITKCEDEDNSTKGSDGPSDMSFTKIPITDEETPF